ncbi:hypothetical protein [Scytonema sp. NUACC26]|uniref:hypothetical protein n=1 Tax=Scytonema sp. NUACC26 TaxID=3140176 RepID=UPI0034DC4F91
MTLEPIVTETIVANKKKPKYVNPSEFYANEMDSWTLLWDEDKSLYENIHDLVAGSVFLPNPAILNPLVTTYILMPSKWARIAGVMFSFGDEGSGKSTIAKLANKIHGLKATFSPTDTFASIRNALDKMRWVDSFTKEFEKEGSILCWDNLHIETLKRDLKIYQLLLSGYDRATDRMQTASSNGENKEYYVFCPKIISSVEPIHLYHEFAELRRRLIVVPHKKFEKFSPEERKYYQDVDIAHDRIDLDSFSWKGIENKYFDFWADEKHYSTYVGWRKILTQRGKKSFKIPSHVTSPKWTITIDLVATGLTVGAWSDMQDAIDFFGNYWRYSDDCVYGQFSATLEHLRQFVDEETEQAKKVNEAIVEAGGRAVPIIINPKKLKDRLAFLQAEGSLDITPKTADITSLMWQMGYKLTTKGWLER